jgi:hypothetical protein
MTHTPGPWYVNGDCIEADGPEGPRDITVAVATETRRGCDNGADARLIAAAPEMLELLRSARPIVEAAGHMDLSVKIWNLIAKAEGRE